MNNKAISLLGLLGVFLLVFTFIISGLLIENYDIKSQFISESFAVDTEYGLYLRIFGYIPSGIIIAIFCFNKIRLQPKMCFTFVFYLSNKKELARLYSRLHSCESTFNVTFN